MTYDSQNIQRRDNSTDQFDLLDLFFILLKHKWMILTITFIGGIISLFSTVCIDHKPVSLESTDRFYSKSTIAPRDMTLEELNGMFAQTRLMAYFIDKHNLLPVLYPDLFDQQTSSWKSMPTKDELFSSFKIKVISAQPVPNAPALEITCYFLSSNTVNHLLEDYINELRNSILSERNRSRLKTNKLKKALISELTNTNALDLRRALSEKIIDLTIKEKALNNDEFIPFDVIFPASKPEKVMTLYDSPKPRIMSMMVLLSAILAFFVGITLAFFIEYIKKMIIRRPDKMEKIKKYL